MSLKRACFQQEIGGNLLMQASYLANNSEVIGTFGSITAAATQHYVNNGYGEGRTF